MNKRLLIWLGLGFGVWLPLGPQAVVEARLLRPASAQEILDALGADAKGLRISQEKLPDLFLLTASRLDENSKTFIVEGPYAAGRWKGGKAIVEYARDLSYTMVSVYDKKGRRQRIYSVTSRLDEVAPPALAKEPADTASSNEQKSVIEVPSQSATAVDPSPPPAPPSPPAIPSSEPKKVIEVAAKTTEEPSRTASRRTRRRRVHPSEMPSPEKPSPEAPSKKARRVSPSKAPAPARDVPAAPAVHQAQMPSPTKPAASAPPSAKKESATLARVEAPVASPPAAFEWDEEKNAYVPVKGSADSSSSEKAIVPPPTNEQVPTTEELLTASPDVARKPLPAAEKPAAPLSTPPTPPPAEAPAARSDDPALALAKDKYPAPETSRPEPVQPPVEVPAKTPSKELDTSESDRWVPKETPKPQAPEPEKPALPAPAAVPQVAMVPKPVDNSIDALLKIAGERKAGTSNESDAWVPRAPAAPTPDAELNAALERARQMKKPVTAAPAPIRRDVNNPEEGVLPVSQFEKFSGPRYGRHREYERRFFVGKRPQTPVRDYDFYVDEVDRKKEIHNVYYYKRDRKVPRLVAVEHHEHVTFLSNYDVDKEDKGKVTTY